MARTVPFRLCPLRCRSIEGPESATGTSEFLLFYRAFCKFRHRRRCGKLTNISCRWPRGAALRGPALAPLQCHFNVTWLRCAVLPCLVHQQTGAGTRLDACAPRADAPPLQSSPIRCRSISAIAPAASSHSSFTRCATHSATPTLGDSGQAGGAKPCRHTGPCQSAHPRHRPRGSLLAATFIGPPPQPDQCGAVARIPCAAARHLQDRRSDPLGSPAALVQGRANGATPKRRNHEYHLGGWQMQ